MRNSHPCGPFLFFFFFNDTATTEIYTLSLHDALPIFADPDVAFVSPDRAVGIATQVPLLSGEDRKSTRLNSSHVEISYAVFCLKKKKKKKNQYYLSKKKKNKNKQNKKKKKQ